MDKYYTFNDVCEIFGISRKTLYNWWDNGKVPEPQYINGRPFFKKNKINQILNSDRAVSRTIKKSTNMAKKEELIISFDISASELLDSISGVATALHVLISDGNYNDNQLQALTSLQRLLSEGFEEIQEEL